jgi:hypothetical protein
MGSPANQYFPPAERKKIENAIPAPATAAPVPTAGTFANPVLSKQYFKAMAAAGNNPYWGDPSYKDYDPAKRLLKPIIPGKPNPNIGMGLKTPSSLPQFGEPGWVNPNYDPYHNAAGYHRFDPTIPGMGLQMHKTYASGAASYDSYQKLTPGAGYAATSNQFLTENGINPATATDMQKFAAMDYAGRLGQWKNQRPKRKFGIAQAFGLAAQIIGAVYGGPWGAAAGSAFSTGIQGGDLGDIAKSAAIAGAATYAGGAIGSKLGGGATAGNSVDRMFAAAANSGSKASTLGKIAAGVGSAYKTAAPYLTTAGKIAGTTGAAINQSGVTLTPTQYSNLQGGNPAVTTFEPENKNIALSPHPTSAYAAAYPNAPDSSVSPINTAPVAPINQPIATAPINQPIATARPYVAPLPVQIAPNIDILKYDPSRNYSQAAKIAPNIGIIKYDPRRNYSQTMQQALMRPAATRASA